MEIHAERQVAATVTDEAALDDVLDLIRERLPAIPLDDVVRPFLASLVPLCGESHRHGPATAHDADAGHRTGEDVLNEILDLIGSLLPRMRSGGSVTHSFQGMACRLNQALGRPAVRLVSMPEEA